MKKLLLFLLLLLFSVRIFSLSKVVFGYYPTWYNGDGTLPASSISYNKISHIGLAFAIVNNNGTLSLDANFITCRQAILPSAHSNGVRVIVSIGGDGNGTQFDSAVTNYRTTFVNNIVNLVKDSTYPLDGVDLDWEFPSDATDKANYTAFVQQLRSALTGTNYFGEQYYLSVATAANNYYGQWFDVAAMSSYVTYFHVMSYDYFTSGSGISGPNAALYNGCGGQFDHVDGAMAWWNTTGGMPVNKTLMGLPFYGRLFNANSLCVGASAPSQNDIKYCTIVGGGYTITHDSTRGCGVATGSGTVIGFDDVQTINEKCDFVSSQGYPGVIIWALGQDYCAGQLNQPLLNAVATKFAGTPTPTPTGPTPTPTNTPPYNVYEDFEYGFYDPASYYYADTANGASVSEMAVKNTNPPARLGNYGLSFICNTGTGASYGAGFYLNSNYDNPTNIKDITSNTHMELWAYVAANKNFIVFLQEAASAPGGAERWATGYSGSYTGVGNWQLIVIPITAFSTRIGTAGNGVLDKAYIADVGIQIDGNQGSVTSYFDHFIFSNPTATPTPQIKIFEDFETQGRADCWGGAAATPQGAGLNIRNTTTPYQGAGDGKVIYYTGDSTSWGYNINIYSSYGRPYDARNTNMLEFDIKPQTGQTYRIYLREHCSAPGSAPDCATNWQNGPEAWQWSGIITGNGSWQHIQADLSQFIKTGGVGNGTLDLQYIEYVTIEIAKEQTGTVYIDNIKFTYVPPTPTPTQTYTFTYTRTFTATYTNTSTSTNTPKIAIKTLNYKNRDKKSQK